MESESYRQITGRLQGLTTAELYDLRKEIDKLLTSPDAQVKQGKPKSRHGWIEIKTRTKTLKNGQESVYKYAYRRWIDDDGKRHSEYLGRAEDVKMAQPKRKAA